MYRVGFVGAGGMARLHASSFASLPDFEVVSFMDVREEQAESAAAPYKAAVFDDVQKMLDDASLDVVAICTPSVFHHQYAMLAAESGVHAFVEKPLAMKASGAKEVVEAFRKSGKVLMVGHVVRFFGEYAQARNRLLSGAIGNPVMIRTTRAGRMPRGVGNWFGNYPQSGGVILDLLIHDLDYAIWCFGPAKRVYAKSAVSDVNATNISMDLSFLTVKFQNGVIGHFEGNWALPDGFYTAFEMSGSGGIIQYDSRRVSPLLLSEAAADEGQKPNVFLPESPLHECPYKSEIRHFADVLMGNSELLVKPEDAVASVGLAENAWWSLKTGQPVEIRGGAQS